MKCLSDSVCPQYAAEVPPEVCSVWDTAGLVLKQGGLCKLGAWVAGRFKVRVSDKVLNAKRIFCSLFSVFAQLLEFVLFSLMPTVWKQLCAEEESDFPDNLVADNNIHLQ